jgi:dUTPase
VFGRSFEPWHIAAITIPVAASGLIALQCQTDMVQRAKGVRPRSGFFLKHGLRLTPSLYGGGVGAFLFVLFTSFLP